MIPFSPPRIDQRVIDEVTAALTSGWITTGPRTKLFEKQLTEYCGNKCTVAVSSWTAGMELLLRWWGIGAGDEVIIPAITYCASANVVIHTGAKPVMVDINSDDFNISVAEIRKAITSRTKVIMPVDIGGFPCDYDAIYEIVNDPEIKKLFQPGSEYQEKLGRILVAADAAHSFGAIYAGKRSGSLADVSCFSFHAVKNLTTAEGGSMTLNLPDDFDHQAIYKELCVKILHGQNKDALAKAQKGNWRYDVAEPGFKCNMTDLQAAIGLVELDRFHENLVRRKAICLAYNEGLKNEPWAILPKMKDEKRETCYHLYQLRVAGASEAQRDAVMQAIFDQDVSVNVHFQPLPILTAYKKMGYNIADYPEAWDKYSNEITLPVYFDLTDEQVQTILHAVKTAVKQVMG
ncbi:DegT/DnrJ/EryC1/StrS aminotransferase family protein [Fluviicola sp.]|jgi:dTDP-4-amino-4,6-dideoxygalactose transaminase|uniref:DegT/DnrJ/EryC1/StrS family aminotransferase n=1 Tax=Fluviicola sp. TaxID=1917219 RepID=UPI002838FF96|nr:DegT/DnrJ/EryC1/StrS aminotransferase family protein [Fluviicola sp.]MDR0801629.1 DegT/DnrJ/EryC1/StrS aminotransferase family protein [Fluviicola sp.]